METFIELSHAPVCVEETDVLVCGGGPAGIGAALQAAQLGMRVMVLEMSGCLGGIATAGMMSHWGGRSSSKFLPLITERSRQMDLGFTWLDENRPGRHPVPHDLQMIVLEEMMAEAGAVENDCEDLANLPGRIRGSIVNITIRELGDGRCKASVRTNDQVDASAICAKLGGGGHKMASGCTMLGSAEEMEQALLAAVNEVWPE